MTSMNRSQVLVAFLEEIAGNAAIVYHRTGAKAFTDAYGTRFSGKDIPENIVYEGFAEGRGGTYGDGIYATYKLNSQFRGYMSTYGEYLVKCRVNLQGYIILDYAEARKVYKEKYTLSDQLSQYYSPRWLKDEAHPIAQYHTQLQESPDKKTSPIASELSEHYHIDRIVPGMLFTGNRDDAVVVTYDPQVILPIAYAYHPVGENTPIVWKSFTSSTYRSHIRKAGSLIRSPSTEKIGDSQFSALYQKLGGFTPFYKKHSGLTTLSPREIVQKLKKITSLSTEYTSAGYGPQYDILPVSLHTMVNQKFAQPEAEFHALITPILDRRLTEGSKKLSQYLRKLLPSAVGVACQPTEKHHIKITLTFPSMRSVLLFIQELSDEEKYDIRPVLDFLAVDTPVTRGNLLEKLIDEITTRQIKEFFPPLYFYTTEFMRLVQNAPSTR